MVREGQSHAYKLYRKILKHAGKQYGIEAVDFMCNVFECCPGARQLLSEVLKRYRKQAMQYYSVDDWAVLSMGCELTTKQTELLKRQLDGVPSRVEIQQHIDHQYWNPNDWKPHFTSNAVAYVRSPAVALRQFFDTNSGTAQELRHWSSHGGIYIGIGADAFPTIRPMSQINLQFSQTANSQELDNFLAVGLGTTKDTDYDTFVALFGDIFREIEELETNGLDTHYGKLIIKRLVNGVYYLQVVYLNFILYM